MAKKISPSHSPRRFVIAVTVLCIVSVSLLLARILSSDSMRYVFLLWNLVLAAIPILIVWFLVERLKENRWLAWPQIFLTVLYLGFLPNSFYLITDFVHIRETYEVSLIYDVIMLASFMWGGLVLGFSSVYLIHGQIKKRFSENKSLAIVGTIFFVTSFAIYLGRYTRWNTWDLLLQPAGLLFDVSDRFVNPEVHTDTYVTTFIIFILLSVLYLVIYEASKLVRR